VKKAIRNVMKTRGVRIDVSEPRGNWFANSARRRVCKLLILLEGFCEVHPTPGVLAKEFVFI
jgi:hypothetical protein